MWPPLKTGPSGRNNPGRTKPGGGVDAERLRIAREMHDVVSHSIAMMTIQTGGAVSVLDAHPEQAHEALVAIKEAGQEALRELRGILGVLREADDPGLRGPSPGLDQIADLVKTASQAGLPTAVSVLGNRSNQQRLEEVISRWGRLRVEPRGADIEFWVTHRRGHHTSVLSVSLLGESRKSLREGSLKPDVAAALVRAVPIQPSAVFLDPFAGSGTILKARAAYPHAAIIGCDVDLAAISFLRSQHSTGAFGPRAQVIQADMLAPLASLRDRLSRAGVDTLITDPPWGIYKETAVPVPVFYAAMWQSLSGILVRRARAVVLTGNRSDAESALEQSALSLRGSAPVLINGRKAFVLTVEAHPMDE